jgi:hypothetical protein
MDNLTHFWGVERPTITIHAKATHHRNGIEVWIPTASYSKIESGWEARLNEDSNRTLRGQSMFRDDNVERSLRRTKREIKSLAINNDFQLWVTLTMAHDRQDDEKTYQKIDKWLRSEKRRVGKFDYLIVAERHKDGAIHFHALFGGYKGELEEAINFKTGKLHKPHGRQIYHFKTYNHGFSMVEYIDSPDRIATYITKYVTKDLFATGFNKKRYWSNRGLKKPKIEDNPEWLPEAMGKQTKNIALEQGMLFYFPTSVATPVTSSRK